MNNDEVKAQIAVLDGTDPGFWGLAPGEHVAIFDGGMVHLDANNKVVGFEFFNGEGETLLAVDVEDGIPTVR